MAAKMKFYDRQDELMLLKHLDQQALKRGVMTVLTGRRRVGKTVLALNHVQGKCFLYLFVGRKEEHILCQDFLEEIKKQFEIPIIGDIRLFKDVFVLFIDTNLPLR
jgi:AAA+ ATPase superfamily predicted ATPase